MNWSEYFYYDETSWTCLRWKVQKGTKLPGDIAGSVAYHSDGRPMTIQVGLNKKNRKSHRIIWEMFNCVIPEGMLIDHLDGNPFNNKISNLALKTKRGNQQNQKLRRTNTNGVKGVSWVTRKDSQYTYAEARVYTKNGDITKIFSTRYLGHEGALSAAKKWREQKLEELNEQGEEYTDRHIYGE